MSTGPLKRTFMGYYISALRRCCALKFLHEGVPPKNCNRENLKFGQKFRLNNFRTTGSILRKLFSVDVPRGRNDKLSTIFGRPAPNNVGGPKNCPKFCAIFDNFRLWSRISPERIHISKIGKVVYQLPPLPRWVKKVAVVWSINKKVIEPNVYRP